MRSFRRARLMAALTVLPLSLTLVAAEGDNCRSVDPDQVADSGDEYDICTVQTYFHASDPNKVSNLADQDGSPLALPSWDTNPPAGSVTGGNGAGYAASSPAGNAGQGRAVFVGTFEGELDVLDFDLHLLYHGLFQPDDIDVNIVIDDAVYAIASQFEVKDGPAPTASTPATFMQEFAVTGIRAALERRGLPTDGTHTIRVEVAPYFTDSGNWAYVYDTTEVPSGILFNPEVLATGTPTIGAF